MERPIIFNTPMVQAILAGDKTQTRRVINNLNCFGQILEFQETESPGYDWIFRTKRQYTWNDISHKRLMECCPFGQKGDFLYVRETWAISQTVDHIRRPDGRSFSAISDGTIEYKADGYESIDDLKEHILLMCEAEAVEVEGWKPSIHMPKKYARTWLKITDIRVEYLNAITRKDIVKEGVCRISDINFMDKWIDLWDSINGKRDGCSWENNPYVFVVEFERCDHVPGR